MTKKNTKRALLSSVLALVLCFSMLLGTTYAWFTDSVTSAGNIIKSGTLDIDLLVKGGNMDTAALDAAEVAKDGDYYSFDSANEKGLNPAVFNYDLWEPGYTTWANVKVINKGTLALKYTMRIVADGEVGDLAKVIDVYYKAAEVEKPATRDLTGLTKVGTLYDVMNGASGVMIDDFMLADNTADFATIALHMQEEAGNEYQNKSIGASFSIQLLATQYPYEEDSFDKNYDANADGTPDNASFAVTRTAVSNAATVAAGAPVTVSAPVAPASGSNSTQVQFPAGVLTADTNIQVEVTTEDVIGAADKFEVSGENGAVASIDLTLLVNNVKESNPQFNTPVTVTTYIAKGLNGVGVVYNGDGDDPTYVFYDGTTGKLEFKTTHFSEFVATSSDQVYNVDSGTAYATITAAFAAVKDGETLLLLKNVVQDDGVSYNKENTSAKFDLNGYTFTVNSGSNVNNRAIRIDNGTLEVYNGKIVAVGSGTTSANGAGCYGAFRVEAGGELIAHDLELTNSRPWGLNVKVLGGKAELTNVKIASSYGGGIEVTEADLGEHSKPGTATLTDCTFTQTGYFDHCSTCLSVSGGSKLTINSGSYTGDNYALYVFSSGGEIEVKGGTFSGNKDGVAIVAMIDTNTYSTYTGGLKISGGNFSGGYSITSPAYLAITGGTFDHDPSAYVATGYQANDSGNGLWTVVAAQ